MKNEYCIAFYNLENLFDTTDDPHTLDDDFTPKGFKKWKDNRYRSKLNKLAKAISKIGEEDADQPPVLIGVAEVENSKVLRKLLKTKYLEDFPYDFVHFDSPDERGIDTALIYNTEFFEPLHTETIPLLIVDEDGDRDYTRDILMVRGKLNGEEITVFVNHWPSRRDGAKETEQKRITAAQTILDKIALVKNYGVADNFIIMGDFNDDPNSTSIQTLMDSGMFINPSKKLLSPFSGSANYKGEWTLFDQILISHSFLNHEPGTHTFEKASIFAPKFLREWKGKYKGNPFRTFAGKKYIGGYSDHFPVYVVLELND
ncbi:endonuclease [Croceivirga thetidis]|uniref:Endonuclease n=1 Tax=Croceivirga thetidis TaxID=2721623 RepID=A0ABX1GNF8_9FLAO|nr:endonuclease [Croceivirga thetidis]NKI31099.1 endonuclease [Croceivirga thetidis]